MSYFTRLKLAKLDKRITKLLFRSSWYQKNIDKDKHDMSLIDIDRNEEWVKELYNFIEIIWGNKNYRKHIDQYSLNKEDLVDFFLLMTIATMPNPLFKSGPSVLTNTLVGTAMYQEIDKQLIQCLNTLGYYDNKEEQEQFGHKYASDVMSFAIYLKNAHDMAYGEITFKDVL